MDESRGFRTTTKVKPGRLVAIAGVVGILGYAVWNVFRKKPEEPPKDASVLKVEYLVVDAKEE